MALSRLGDFIELTEEKNSNLQYGVSDVRGISIKKIFIPTKADMDGVPLTSYKLVKPFEFCYVTITSRNGEKITIALNDSDKTYICSSSYIAFRIKDITRLLPFYLYMYFNRPEFDRYSRFNSWGSAREAFSWEDMCDIEIDIPPIEVQQKVVDVYLAMVANQNAYEKGLDDLKLTCDAYIENLRKSISLQTIRDFMVRGTKNTNESIKEVLGIGQSGFIKPQKQPNDSLKNYKIINKDDIVYAPPLYNILSDAIGCYNGDNPVVCSPIYEVFSVKTPLLARYLLMWLKRSEFKRYAEFHSGGVRNTFDYELMENFEIPIPNQNIQKDIVEVFEAYEIRKRINENLKKQINEICPILIKGSINK